MPFFNPPGTIGVIDPFNRTGKITVPLQFVQETKGMLDVLASAGHTGQTKDLSLCLLFQKGRCNVGLRCNQIHAAPEYVDALRAQAAANNGCCAAHGDVHSVEYAGMALTGASVVLVKRAEQGEQRPDSTERYSVASFARTDAMDKLWQRAQQQGATEIHVPHTRVCRLHQTGRCKFGRDCKNIHLCVEARPIGDAPQPLYQMPQVPLMPQLGQVPLMAQAQLPTSLSATPLPATPLTGSPVSVGLPPTGLMQQMMPPHAVVQPQVGGVPMLVPPRGLMVMNHGGPMMPRYTVQGVQGVQGVPGGVPVLPGAGQFSVLPGAPHGIQSPSPSVLSPQSLSLSMSPTQQSPSQPTLAPVRQGPTLPAPIVLDVPVSRPQSPPPTACPTADGVVVAVASPTDSCLVAPEGAMLKLGGTFTQETTA